MWRRRLAKRPRRKSNIGQARTKLTRRISVFACARMNLDNTHSKEVFVYKGVLQCWKSCGRDFVTRSHTYAHSGSTLKGPHLHKHRTKPRLVNIVQGGSQFQSTRTCACTCACSLPHNYLLVKSDCWFCLDLVVILRRVVVREVVVLQKQKISSL